MRERVREALAAARPGAVVGEVVIKPQDLRALLRKVQVARQRAKKQDAEAHKLLRLAARELEAKGVGRRDAGELLGVSFQRVQQLVDE
ncbi:MAG: hypothetical protein E6J67_22885 [Deltaproteobacteria bacterium]|nr:MAG: hypothetical protein E6J67_22885 [Deltaproteobacteria bacterium]